MLNSPARTRGLAIVVLALALVGASVSPALAEGLPEPEPSRAPVTALEITSPEPGAFLGGRSTVLEGTASTGSTVVVTESGRALCTAEVTDSAWTCSVALRDGALELTATERVDGAVIDSVSIAVRVLGPPEIDGADGMLTAGFVSGSAYPNAVIAVVVTGPGSFTQNCPAATPSGYWSCSLGSGGGLAEGTYTLRATQGTGVDGEVSEPSPARVVVIDTAPPAAPVISTPAAGSRIEAAATVTGTGEDAGRVQLFVDGVLLCETVVSGGTWRCSLTGLAAGERELRALQRDAAGNYSGLTPPVRVVVAPAEGVAPTPGATPTRPTPRPTPRAPAPSESPSETPSGEAPAPSPSTESPAPGSPSPAPAPPTDGGEVRVDAWAAPTGFGSAPPPLTVATDAGSWAIGVGLAAAFIALVALPARLLARTFPVALPRARVTGRNRGRDAIGGDEPLIPPALLATAAVLGAALLAALAVGIDSEVRYARLIAAIGLGVVALNVLGVALPARLAGGRDTGFRLVPTFLLVGALTTVLSRVNELDPPVILGVLIAPVLAETASTALRGRVALAQIGAVTALALGAWALRTPLAAATGFWAELASETLATLVLGGLASAMLLALPVSTLPGRAVLEWSPLAWALSTVVLVTVAALVFVSGAGFPVDALVGAALAFAGVSVAAWGWVRWVQPAQ